MTAGTDVTGALGWSIRKYSWLIALFVIALGGVVPAALQQVPEQYEASAQVGPTKGLRVSNLDVLPRMATDVFRSIPNDPDVKAAAGGSASRPLTSDQLELVAAQDNIIFTVVARSDSPEVARDVANLAAVRFVDELNVYSQPIGFFSVNRRATAPTEPSATLAGPTAWGLGIAAGLLAGVGTVALLVLLRRPVIDVATAGHQTGAPVLGRITLGRRGTPATGMTQVCHRLLSQPTGMMLMVGASDTRHARRELTAELVRWMSPLRRVIPLGSREPVNAYGSASLALPGSPDVLFILDNASPVEVATRPERSLTLLVIREGITRTALQEMAQQYLDGGNGAVVLVRRASRRSQLRLRVRSTGRRRRRAHRTTTTYEPQQYEQDTSFPRFYPDHGDGDGDGDGDQRSIPTRHQDPPD